MRDGRECGRHRRGYVEERAMSLTLFTGEGIVIMHHSVLCPTYPKTKICEKLGLESGNLLRNCPGCGNFVNFLVRNAIYAINQYCQIMYTKLPFIKSL